MLSIVLMFTNISFILCIYKISLGTKTSSGNWSQFPYEMERNTLIQSFFLKFFQNTYINKAVRGQKRMEMSVWRVAQNQLEYFQVIGGGGAGKRVLPKNEAVLSIYKYRSSFHPENLPLHLHARLCINPVSTYWSLFHVNKNEKKNHAI